MVVRNYWMNKIQTAWKKVPIVWLSGVRRVGKTTLSKSIANSCYLNCDLPSTASLLEDPERIYTSVDKSIIIFDEIHRLPDPSLILKIGEDTYSNIGHWFLYLGCYKKISRLPYRSKTVGAYVARFI